jgi:hypothetical protein
VTKSPRITFSTHRLSRGLTDTSEYDILLSMPYRPVSFLRPIQNGTDDCREGIGQEFVFEGLPAASHAPSVPALSRPPAVSERAEAP